MSASPLRYLVCCLFAALVHVTPLHAQSDDATRAAAARALFEQGLQKADAAAWQEAADLFERALAQRDSPVIRFNLSAAWVELGRLVEASELLRELQADERANPQVRRSASDKRDVLLPRLAQLTIAVQGHDPSLLVLLDDKKVAPERLGSALAVDPRVHHVVLRSGERVLDQKQVLLMEGESLEVQLVGHVEAPVVATAPPLRRRMAPARPAAHQDDAQESRDDSRRRRLWWGLGGAAVAVAAGVVTGVLLAQRGADTPSGGFSPGSVGVRVPQ